jgi:hypothetical protein
MLSTVFAYFGGCRPGLFAHRSRFSSTLSWLGRFAGLGSVGLRGDLGSFSIGALLRLQSTPSAFDGQAIEFQTKLHSFDDSWVFQGTDADVANLDVYSFVLPWAEQ